MVSTYYVCSDIHDDVPALAVFTDFVQAKGAAGIFVLGDLSLRPYTEKSLDDFLLTKDAETFIAEKRAHTSSMYTEMNTLLKQAGIPYWVIPGNYDSKTEFETVFGKQNMHEQEVYLEDAKVFGYGSSDVFALHLEILFQFGELVDFDENKLRSQLEESNPDLILVHTPPLEMCDNRYDGRHMGALGLGKYLSNPNLKKSPKLILCGHVHEAGPSGRNPHSIKGLVGYQHPKTGQFTLVVNPGNLGKFELVDPSSLRPLMYIPHRTFVSVDLERDGTLRKVVQYALADDDKNIQKLAEFEL
ncbi:MAG: metallophosphoesterase [Nanoarchaeota archaeon]